MAIIKSIDDKIGVTFSEAYWKIGSAIFNFPSLFVQIHLHIYASEDAIVKGGVPIHTHVVTIKGDEFKNFINIYFTKGENLLESLYKYIHCIDDFKDAVKI